MVGPVTLRSRLRALTRTAAVGGLVGAGLLVSGLSTASAQIGLPPLPTPTVSLPALPTLGPPVPTPTLSLPALPTLTPIPTLPPLPTDPPLPILPPLPTPTPPVPVPTPTLCIGIDCPLPVPTPTLPVGGSGVPTPTPTQLCLGSVCIPQLPGGGGPGPGNGGSGGTSCTLPVCVSPDPGCLLNPLNCPIVPTGNPGPCLINCTPTPGPGGGGGHTPTINSPGGTFDGGGGGSPSASTGFSVVSFGGGGGALNGGTAVPLGLAVATVPAVQQLSPVSGLQFGHALILWPLFGALDLLGLGVVYLVVRRSRAHTPD